MSEFFQTYDMNACSYREQCRDVRDELDAQAMLVETLRDNIREDKQKIEDLEEQNAKLNTVINRVLNDEYDRELSRSWFKDKRPSKHDICKHGNPLWDDCEQCVLDGLAKLYQEVTASE